MQGKRKQVLLQHLLMHAYHLRFLVDKIQSLSDKMYVFSFFPLVILPLSKRNTRFKIIRQVVSTKPNTQKILYFFRLFFVVKKAIRKLRSNNLYSINRVD